MKKITILLLAIVLTACGAPAPAAPAEQAVAPAPAEPVVVTVVVEPTQAPAEPVAPAAPAEPVVVTVVVEPTSAPAEPAAPAPAPVEPAVDDGTVALDDAFGKGVFVNMTMSSSNFTLRCSPRDITFNVTAPNTDIKDVLLYYRTADIKRLYPSEWRAFGNMTANGNGNFTLTFSGEDIHPDLRIDGSYFDFQFIGLAKSGDVVDRSQKIESLVQYTFDCP
ncbi:MAG TPA: hypothetical protein VJ972_05640 [Anaerolineales bacterium]|nr:hypothetical protein [Anaerolineales bacterium]